MEVVKQKQSSVGDLETKLAEARLESTRNKELDSIVSSITCSFMLVYDIVFLSAKSYWAMIVSRQGDVQRGPEAAERTNT